MKHFIILVSIVFNMWAVINLEAQVFISAGSEVVENFAIGNSAQADLPSSWKIDYNTNVRTVGTYVAALNQTAQLGGNNMGITSTPGIYNFATGDSTTGNDRAVGWLASASAHKSGNLYVLLKNNGLNGIHSFDISYNLEKYKKGSNAAGFTIQLYYSLDGINWTNAGNDFKTDFNHDGTDNSGYANAPGHTVQIQNKILNISIPAQDSIYIAWNYSVTTGNNTEFAQALGIDDVIIKAVPYPAQLDLSINKLISPTYSCNLGNNENISILLINNGLDTISTFDIIYSIDGGTTFITPETYMGQFLPGDSLQYTFSTLANVSNTGIYDCIFAVNLTGDEDNLNDTLLAAINHLQTINSFPYTDDLESISLWYTDGYLWEKGIPSQQNISSAYSGSQVWMTGLSTHYNNNSTAYLYSPCYDFTNLVAPIFSVWLNMQIQDAGNDAMILEYSTDNGQNWLKVNGTTNFYNFTDVVGSLTSPKWSGITNGWEKFETSIAFLSGTPQVKFRFHFNSNNNLTHEGIAIDDISIRDPFAVDLAIVEWINPQMGCGLSSTSTITVKIANIGLDTIHQFPITYSLDGTNFINDEIVNTVLAFGDTMSYAFTTPADFSLPALYNCVVKHNLVGDAQSNNDYINKMLLSLPFVNTFPYLENFEGTFSGWQSGAITGNNQWEMGTPSQSAINNASSGTKAWMTRLLLNYQNNTSSYLLSPCYDFTQLNAPVFSAMLNIRTELSYDAMILESSIDGGNSWQKVIGDAGFYNNTSTTGNVTPPKWSGNSNGWQKFETSLNHLAGLSNVRFRFVFTSNGSNNEEGIAIDDIIIRNKYNNDLTVVEWVTPQGGCGLTNSETVSIKVANIGLSAQTGFNLGYSLNGGTYIFETFSGTINPGDTLTYTFSTPANFSSAMNYLCMAFVNLTTDENTSNDIYVTTITSIPFINTFPYFQNFELGQAGWSSEAISGNNPWEMGLPQQSIINSPRSGFNCWMTGLTSNYENNTNAYLLSPCLDFSSLTNPQISLWLNMKIEDEGHDAMILEQSTNGGQTWTKVTGGQYLYNYTNAVGTLASPKWSGDNNGWTEYKSALSGLAGQGNVRLRFRFISNGSITDEGIAIDDIMIHDPFTNDLAVIEWVSPLSECNMGANELVTIKIANLGTVPQSNFTLTYSTDGGANFSPPATYSNTLNPGDTVIYAFPQPANFSLPGEYICFAMVNLTTDQNPNNDLAYTKVFSVPTYNTFPYFDNFESAFSGWTSITLQGVNQWEKGTPNQSALSFPHSGSQAYMTKLSQNYANNSNAVLLSPCLNLSGINNPQLSVWINMKTETGYDAMILEKSIDGGQTWSKFNGTTGFYNNSASNGPINNPPKWSGNTNGWTNFNTNASEIMNQSNVRLRFRFASDAQGNDEGISIDDFLIYQPIANDVGISAIISPISQICGTMSDSIYVEIKNYGLSVQSQIPVKVDILLPSGTMVNKTKMVNANLASGASNIFFIDTLSTSQTGTYFVFATTELASDTINHFNNANTSSFTIQAPLSLPYVENFENQTISWIGNGIIFDQAHGSTSKVMYASLSAINSLREAHSTKIGTLSPHSRIKFDYRFVNASGNAYTLQSGDALQLMISNNCNNTYLPLTEINLNNHTVTAHMQNIEIDLNSFNGSDVFFTFRFISGGQSFFIDIDNIIVADAPYVNLGNDTASCGGSVLLNANNSPNNVFYYWSEQSLPDTISTASYLNVTQSGVYFVIVDNGFGMISVDSIYVVIHALPNFNLGPDLTICAGTQTVLTAWGGTIYQWSTGAGGSSITVNPLVPTNYTVTVTNSNNCSASDAVYITTNPTPIVNLGLNNQIICDGASITLDAGPNNTHYNWSTGATSQTINLNSTLYGYGPFVFSVTVTNIYSCQTSAGISIIFDPCTGIQDLENTSFNCFPNPSDGNVNIQYSGSKIDELQIYIYNAQGIEIAQKLISILDKNHIFDINFSNYSKGVYFIKLVSNNQTEYKKIIIQ